MQDDILQEKNFIKIVLNYQGANGDKINVDSCLRYFDNDACYFGFPVPIKYVEPKKESNICIAACTKNGLYKTKVKLLDAGMSFNEILYRVSLPKKWVVTQRRCGTRKEIKLPLKINFSDGLELETILTDFSVGGVSFIVKQPISNINLKHIFKLTLQFEENPLIDFSDNKLTLSARMLRYSPIENDEIKCACCFVNIPKQIKEKLKRYIMLHE